MKICKDGRIWGQNNKEAKEHLGILTGRKRKDGSKGNKNPMYRRHHSAETRIKMSIACRGGKRWNWKGGITSRDAMIRHKIEYKLWREAVFARDNWTCQECGKRGGTLHAHHIKSFINYSKLRLNIENGVTLCFGCHKKTDSYGGDNTGDLCPTLVS